MTPPVPAEIDALAMDRSRARIARNWSEADRLKAAIEDSGWKVIDVGTAYDLVPAHPPTLEDDGVVRYGRSVDVPSRLEEAPVGVASVVLVATDWPDDVERTLSGLLEHGPDGVQVVVVGDGPSPEQAAALDRLETIEPGAPGIRTEVVRTSARLGSAAALNAAIRRAESATVVLLDSSVEPTGDLVSPLQAALADPEVAVAGSGGVVTRDIRRFEDAPPGDVDAITLECLAFRRADYIARGPLDEKFRHEAYLGMWWSLVLRDEGEGRAPRRALALDLPIVRHKRRQPTGVEAAEATRASKRNFYRLLDRFGQRRDLASGRALT
jgi:Glycosyl transferase family 2